MRTKRRIFRTSTRYAGGVPPGRRAAIVYRAIMPGSRIWNYTHRPAAPPPPHRPGESCHVSPAAPQPAPPPHVTHVPQLCLGPRASASRTATDTHAHCQSVTATVKSARSERPCSVSASPRSLSFSARIVAPTPVLFACLQLFRTCFRLLSASLCPTVISGHLAHCCERPES